MLVVVVAVSLFCVFLFSTANYLLISVIFPGLVLGQLLLEYYSTKQLIHSRDSVAWRTTVDFISLSLRCGEMLARCSVTVLFQFTEICSHS